MKEIKPDSKDQHINGTSIFLAGSIEMGVAYEWQSALTKHFNSYDVTFLNPRRDSWDSSWVQSIKNPKFVEQVNWELSRLEIADIVFVYFDPWTKSPISLMELGKFGNTRSIACCPKGFWRKGNVEVFCKRYDIPLFENITESYEALKKLIK